MTYNNRTSRSWAGLQQLIGRDPANLAMFHSGHSNVIHPCNPTLTRSWLQWQINTCTPSSGASMPSSVGLRQYSTLKHCSLKMLSSLHVARFPVILLTCAFYCSKGVWQPMVKQASSRSLFDHRSAPPQLVAWQWCKTSDRGVWPEKPQAVRPVERGLNVRFCWARQQKSSLLLLPMFPCHL
jgi:hypothetical protein